MSPCCSQKNDMKIGFVLIDSPLTPFSTRREIVQWAAYCRNQAALSGNPVSREAWQRELDETERLLAQTLADGNGR